LTYNIIIYIFLKKKSEMNQKTVALNTGAKIPVIGLGTCKYNSIYILNQFI